MSQGTILIASFLAIFLIGGPIASVLGTHSPSIGVIVGIVVFIILSVLSGETGGYTKE